MNAALKATGLALLLASHAHAACPAQDPLRVGGTQGYAGRNAGKCFVFIRPMNDDDLVYRAHVFYDTGLLMIFSSYGPGEDVGRLTSAREYYMFPRRSAPRLDMDVSARTVSVLMADGRRAIFNPATAQFAALDGDVAVSPVVDPAVRGGVEITRYAGLLLDLGYRQGAQPSGRPEGDATFRSPHGQFCTVKNSELFDYAPNGEHAFKFTDARLSAWLRQRCPALPVDF